MERFIQQFLEMLSVFIQVACSASPSVFLNMPLSEFLEMVMELQSSNKQNASSSYRQNSSLFNFSQFTKHVALSQVNDQKIPEEMHATSSKGKQIEDLLVAEQTDAINHRSKTKPDKPIINRSLVCPTNSAESTSNQPKVNLKRKSRETDESYGPRDCLNEDIGKGPFKLNRNEEANNLWQSINRNRERLNEKFIVLKELIPNCTKVDKLSLLDEAIDYIKKLKHEVQIMKTSKANPYMLPMMQPLKMAQMGFGMDMVNMTSGSHFSLKGLSTMNGFEGMPSKNIQFYGVPNPPVMYSSLVGPSSSGSPTSSQNTNEACWFGSDDE